MIFKFKLINDTLTGKEKGLFNDFYFFFNNCTVLNINC
jgi:hypothetical protein